MSACLLLVRLDPSNDLVHHYASMAYKGMQKLFAGLLIVVGIVLLCMYTLLLINGGRPYGGMFVVGMVDLVVGFVLLRRAKAPQANIDSSK